MVQNVDIFDDKISKLNFRFRNILMKLKDNLNCPKYLDVNLYFNENINSNGFIWWISDLNRKEFQKDNIFEISDKS